MRQYLRDFAHANVSSEQFKTYYLDHFSGVAATKDIDWDAWFYSPGASFFQATIYVLQRLLGGFLRSCFFNEVVSELSWLVLNVYCRSHSRSAGCKRAA